MLDLTPIETFAPTTATSILSFPSYGEALGTFKRGTGNIVKLRARGDVVEPDLDITDHRIIKVVSEFIRWTRTFTTEQWEAGVPLTGPQVSDACGYNNRPIDLARRACLIRVKAGYRRDGEPDTYSLSQPHVLGLAAALAAHVSYQAALSMKAMEDAAADIDLEGRLAAALQGPSTYVNPLLEVTK